MRRSELATSVALLMVFSIGCSDTHGESRDDRPSLVERGRYLTQVAGCHDCHSPKVFTEKGPLPDKTRLLSGHPQDLQLPPVRPTDGTPGDWILFNDHLTAAVGPWGISFAMNLTPDDQTGIGLWTEEIFVNAMRTGLCQRDANRQAHGSWPSDPSSDALVQPCGGRHRGSQSDLCVSAIAPADQESSSLSHST
jgi:hypothetical protein